MGKVVYSIKETKHYEIIRSYKDGNIGSTEYLGSFDQLQNAERAISILSSGDLYKGNKVSTTYEKEIL